MDETEEQISMELETLETIFIHELEIFERNEKYVKTIKVNLKPATGEDTDAQWVCMELWFYIPVGYPDVIPVIAIKNPRGLSENRIQDIKKDLIQRAKDREGMMVLYELIQAAVDHLTAGNSPDCQCSICLYDFTETDVFVKTGCFHYFHGHCLSRYIKYQLEEMHEKKEEAKKNNSPLKEPLILMCPMCRVEIPEDLVAEDSESLPPPSRQLDDPEFRMNPQLETLQRQMTNLYLRQKERGGIIDIEGERNKFFIQISDHQARDESSTQGTQTSASNLHSAKACSTQPPPQQQTHSKGCARRVETDSSDSESDGGRITASRARNRRGKNKMYPTPSEKKRAHLQALQLMKLEQGKTQPETEKPTENGCKSRTKNSGRKPS
ncbi:E3 ubiquitin-protein ligase RNF25 [Galendromus occidentalis]|uniref:E3 ubiquitin-protein ligase RNF25 n=1 Tax=Galendromus occidentalis TaxID=34638 RepID=A0AAJ6QX77_9ACAR|nr:E3 ubiquitin-protein ligase RNF25 [Galendromus occidentalis]